MNKTLVFMSILALSACGGTPPTAQDPTSSSSSTSSANSPTGVSSSGGSGNSSTGGSSTGIVSSTSSNSSGSTGGNSSSGSVSSSGSGGSSGGTTGMADAGWWPGDAGWTTTDDGGLTCTPGTTDCENPTTELICNPDGSSTRQFNCQNGCNGTACNVCQPEISQCLNGNIVECSSDGQSYNVVLTCQFGCGPASGDNCYACSPNQPSIVNDAGTEVQICNSYGTALDAGTYDCPFGTEVSDAGITCFNGCALGTTSCCAPDAGDCALDAGDINNLNWPYWTQLECEKTTNELSAGIHGTVWGVMNNCNISPYFTCQQLSPTEAKCCDQDGGCI